MEGPHNMEEAAMLLCLLGKVGLRGAKLAACQGGEEGLAVQLAERLGIRQEKWHAEYIALQVESACQMQDLESRL